jgi:hypothetical protein
MRQIPTFGRYPCGGASIEATSFKLRRDRRSGEGVNLGATWGQNGEFDRGRRMEWKEL